MYEAQGHACAACGLKRPLGRMDADHELAVALGEAGKPTRLLCKPCHVSKTARDVAMIAKAERQAGRKGQWARREKARKEGRYRPIPGRGFPNRRTFSGEVVRRY